jgi:glycerol-3-phosphate dehydrogenase
MRYSIKKGVENCAADALSRRTPTAIQSCNAITEIVPTWMEELKASYTGDSRGRECTSTNE